VIEEIVPADRARNSVAPRRAVETSVQAIGIDLSIGLLARSGPE
jgi:hypothetical protein